MNLFVFTYFTLFAVFVLTRAEEISSTETNNSTVVNAFENSVAGMESNIKSFMNNIMKEMLPHAIRIGMESEASLSCLFDLTKIFRGVQNLDAWAVRMMDATGKPSGGLMEGTSTALGDYDECLDVRSPAGYPVTGEYCLLEIKPPGSIVDAMKEYQVNKERTNHSIANTKSFIGFLQKVRTNPDHVIFRLGICVPSSCSEKAIQSLLDLAFEDFDLPIKVAHCDYKYEFIFETYEIVIISFIMLLIALVIFGTVVSAVNTHKNISTDTSSDKDGNSSTETSETQYHCFHRCVDAFSKLSLCHNIKRLLNCDSEGDASDVIKGMKVLTIMFAIFTHTYALPHPLHLYRFRNTLNFTKFIDEVLFGAIANSSVGADTFFFLAGFHFIYNRWRMVKRTNILSYILKFISVMYIRMIAIQILVGSFLFLMPTFGSGPLWEEFVEGPIDNCKENWWMNLLFIQNFLGPYDICLYQTWILATIMQIFLITTVIVYLMHRWPTYGILTTIFTLILAMVGIAVVTGVADYPATLTIYFYDYRTSIYFWKHLYTQFYAHIGPQCIGMLLAYFISEYPIRKVDK
ncbi:O-acyltransferase like protein like [Argiope bruennichi]|uniref:O-acyltransferase like protein like n=1 Tax=Argiope bruennichi TaxID=94029 RepID=A0A8T0EZJ8_ARGBR|nr:O-acyltransferase like protein like [Argiope bruennichi]